MFVCRCLVFAATRLNPSSSPSQTTRTRSRTWATTPPSWTGTSGSNSQPSQTADSGKQIVSLCGQGHRQGETKLSGCIAIIALFHYFSLRRDFLKKQVFTLYVIYAQCRDWYRSKPVFFLGNSLQYIKVISRWFLPLFNLLLFISSYLSSFSFIHILFCYRTPKPEVTLYTR